MITPNTVKLVKHQLSPFVEMGNIHESEFQEVIDTLKNSKKGFPSDVPLMTKEEVARFLNISGKTVEAYVTEKKIKVFRIPSPIGGRYSCRFDRIEILKFAGYSEPEIKGIIQAAKEK